MKKIHNKKKDTPLNDFFVVILLISVLGGIGQIIHGFSSISDTPVVSIVSILLTSVALYGIYLILCLKKWAIGFSSSPK